MAEPTATPADAPRLSIVLPVGPGDAVPGALLRQLARLRDVELVVVRADEADAWSGPADGTPVRVLHAPTGRARQLNAGAGAARGALLWFLHADSQPDARALRTADALRGELDGLGWFRLRFHDGGLPHRLNAIGANLRSRWWRLPFGDQGLLLTAAHFARLGGFDERLARGEDLDLVVRARHAGIALRALPGTVATSARRYRAGGWWSTTATHLALTLRLRREALARLRSAGPQADAAHGAGTQRGGG